jgi:hypothetical protein
MEAMNRLWVKTCLFVFLTGVLNENALAEKRFSPVSARLMERVLAVQDLISPNRQKFETAVPKLWREVLEYTQGHSGKDLDKLAWAGAFRTAGEWMLSDRRLSYQESCRLIAEAVDVLRNIEAEDRCLPGKLAMSIAILHAERWMSPHVQECAGMIDNIWKWIRALDEPSLKKTCFKISLFFEGNCLLTQFDVPEQERARFIKDRETKL